MSVERALASNSSAIPKANVSGHLKTPQQVILHSPTDVAALGRDRLLRVLRIPDEMWNLSAKEWEALIPRARYAGVMPQLAARIRRSGRQAEIPPPAWRQMEAILQAADAYTQGYRWEVNRLERAFADVPCRLILLKGAAFLCSEFAWAKGRTFQDIDVLVPHATLPAVEEALRRQGWVNSIQNPLDAEYFKTWLQELAPMWHPERRIQVDLHHSIIPPRDRLPFDPAPLLDNVVPVSESVFVLAPHDMVLHAAVNLFWTGEFQSILAELYDLHSMIDDFARTLGFWPELMDRAERLNLTRPLYYAMRYLREIFNTPIPVETATTLEQYRPSWLPLKIVDALVHRTLFPLTLDEVDETRYLALKVREYWSVPRLAAICTALFWLKRLPDWLLIWLGLKSPEADEPVPRQLLPH